MTGGRGLVRLETSTPFHQTYHFVRPTIDLIEAPIKPVESRLYPAESCLYPVESSFYRSQSLVHEAKKLKDRTAFLNGKRFLNGEASTFPYLHNQRNNYMLDHHIEIQLRSK